MKKFTRRIWTDYEIELLIKIYPDSPSKDIADKLGRSVSTIYNKAYNMGLKKSRQFMESPASGRNNLAKHGFLTRFQKGQPAHNKGKKMDVEVKEKIKHTFFKEGHLPHNTKKDGIITIRVDTKTGRPYKCIRISLGKWELLHRYKWMKYRGSIPEGMIVSFKDGNPLNCVIKNLKLIDRKQNMANNTIHNYPEEIKSTIRALSKLNKSIRKHEE